MDQTKTYSPFINIKDKESTVPNFLKKPNEKSLLLPQLEIDPYLYYKSTMRGRLLNALLIGIIITIFLGVCFICFWVQSQSIADYDTTILSATKDSHSNKLLNSITDNDDDVQIHPESPVTTRTTTAKDIEMLKLPLLVDGDTQICRNALDLEELKKNEQKKHYLHKRDLLVEPDPHCLYPFDQSCNANDEYRSPDGSCNNLKHPNWGASQRPYRRLLMPDYADGKGDEIRVASDGNQLPNVRGMSQRIHTNQQKDDSTLSMLFPIFGQFISHDMSADLSVNLRKNLSLASKACCLPNQKWSKKLPQNCCSIELGKSDIFYRQLKENCMSLARGQKCTVCPKGTRREQYSLATSFLDGSVIYGSNSIRQRNLREGQFGRLKISYDKNNRSMLPILTFPTIQNGHTESLAFNSGDDRVNTNLGISVMTLIWIKNHNHIANHLRKLNPYWDDEKNFQEARKINIAQLQHITYNEYLPNLLGPIIVEKAGLKLAENNEYFYGYDDTVDSTMASEFVAAAHRFGHSLIQGLVPFIKHGQNKNMVKFMNLSNYFENPSLVYKNHGIDALIRGEIACPAAKVGVHMAYPLTNHFFHLNENETFGYDLPAIDIQRGRDHGIPGYGAWRKLCGFHPIQKFSDLIGIWNPEVINHASQMYRSVEDVDLYTAGLAEHHIPGGKVGPTFACIIGDQFYRTRKGDRFWYENMYQPQAFTPAQLNSIRTTTLARIICDNVDSLDQIQMHTLIQTSITNSILDCKDSIIPKIDYELWKKSNTSSTE